MNYTAPLTVGKFMGSDARVRLIVGPVGSGKSSGCCVEIVRRMIEMPPGPDGVRRSRWCIVRNTYRELQDTTIKTWKQWFPDPQYGTWKQSDHVFEVKFETDEGARVEGEVMFRALDKPDDVKKLKSLELTGAYFNEMKEIPLTIFTLMRGRIGRYPRKEDVSRYWTGVIGDTNPCDTDHWIYRLFEEERAFPVWRQPGGRSKDAENLENLDRCFDVDASLIGEARALAKQEQRERLARGEHEPVCRCYYVTQCIGASADHIKVYVDGEYGFVKEGKPIYPEFQDSIHVARETIPLIPGIRCLVIGNDFGLTPAAVWMQQDPQDGQWQVIKELVFEHGAAVEFGKEQRRIGKTEFRAVEEFRGWGDPAGMAGAQTDDTTPIDVVSAQGVPMSPAPTNDFILRREAVAGLLTRLTRLGRPALIISPDCKKLRKAMGGGYCYRRLQVAGDERFEDHPLKNEWSHVAEALQYACVGEGEDHKALDGGHPRRVSVNVRVHRSTGGSSNQARVYEDDTEDDYQRPIRVRRSH